MVQFDINTLDCGPMVKLRVNDLLSKKAISTNNAEAIKRASLEDRKRDLLSCGDVKYVDNGVIEEVKKIHNKEMKQIRFDLLDAVKELQDKTGYNLVDLFEYIKWRFDSNESARNENGDHSKQ